MRFPLLLKIVVAIVLGVLLGHVMSDFGVRLTNTFCALFDQLLRFLIPLIIVGLVTPAIAEVGNRAGKMLLVTVGMAYVFTVFSGLFAYVFSTTLFPFALPSMGAAMFEFQSSVANEYAPFFTIAVPPLMDVMTALVLSFMLGLGIAVTKAPALKRGFFEFKDIVTKTIVRVIIPLLPVYVFGVFLNMAAVGLLVLLKWLRKKAKRVNSISPMRETSDLNLFTKNLTCFPRNSLERQPRI